jgi:hypothetical protein
MIQRFAQVRNVMIEFRQTRHRRPLDNIQGFIIDRAIFL